MEESLHKIGDSANTAINSATNTETNGKTAFKHEAMYKATPSFEEKQEERRTRYLSRLKHKRNNTVDEKRGIEEVFTDVVMPSESDGASETIKSHTRRRKQKKYYGHRIMLSEWLFTIPTDLESKWYFKICPKGRRMLVVASEGMTTVYNRHGIIQSKFESTLPGGSKRGSFARFTILDCIFDFKTQHYFVLDLLAWNSYSYTQMNTDCRFFFLKSKLEELIDTPNCMFVEVPSHRCELPTLEHLLSSPFPQINEQEVDCDGILFYHGDGLYMAGLTPLVLWLKPYMIPELFEIPVHANHFRYRPKTYENFSKFMKDLQDKRYESKMEEEPLNVSTDEILETNDTEENSEQSIEMTYFV